MAALEESEALTPMVAEEVEPVLLKEMLALTPLEEGEGGGCGACATVEASPAPLEEVVATALASRAISLIGEEAEAPTLVAEEEVD